MATTHVCPATGISFNYDLTIRGQIPLPELSMSNEFYMIATQDLSPVVLTSYSKREMAVLICMCLQRHVKVNWDKPFKDSNLATLSHARISTVLQKCLKYCNGMPSFRARTIIDIEVAIEVAELQGNRQYQDVGLDDITLEDAEDTYSKYAGAEGFEYQFVSFVGRQAMRHLKSKNIEAKKIKAFMSAYTEAGKLVKASSHTSIQSLYLKDLQIASKLKLIIDTCEQLEPNIPVDSTASLCLEIARDRVNTLIAKSASCSISDMLKGVKVS